MGTDEATFDHVLLTRFSAVLRPGQEPAGEDWLYYRLGFFLDACLPSVLSQRGARPFTWLVLFDDRCSPGFRADVERLADSAFTPIWTHVTFRRDSFAEYVAAISTAPYLITTRIDSDDAIATDFLAAVQAQFSTQERLFVNFPRGIQIDRSGAVYRSDILSSPFLSLIERRVPGRLPDTVFVAKHARARGHGPLREVRSPVMWAQVLHGTNLSSIVNGVRVDPRVVGERFDFDLGYDARLRGLGLRRAQARQWGRLARLWVAHPGELTKWAEATAWTLLGTHDRAQDQGAPTLTDRVQEWEKDARARLRDTRWTATAKANWLLPGRSRVVAGDVDEVMSRDTVVVLAEWSRGPRLRAEAAQAAQAYAEAGYGVLVMAARDPWARLAVSTAPEGVAVVRRPNVAYDFGSWAEALARWPQLTSRRRVILTNDSLVGPVRPLDGLLDRTERSTADVWAATANALPRPHVQSYLLAFTGSTLAAPQVADFFAQVRPQESKRAVIQHYELGLSRLLQECGLTVEVGWRPEDLGAPPTASLTLDTWEELVDAGFPFVKRALLTQPRFAAVRPRVQALVDGTRQTG